jgi:hypothetical protein
MMHGLANPKQLNSFCHLLELLGAHHILHVSRIRVKPKLYLTSYNNYHIATTCIGDSLRFLCYLPRVNEEADLPQENNFPTSRKGKPRHLNPGRFTAPI